MHKPEMMMIIIIIMPMMMMIISNNNCISVSVPKSSWRAIIKYVSGDI